VALRNPKLTKTQAAGLLESNLEEVAKLKTLSDGLLRLASTDTLKLDQNVSLKAVAEQAIERWAKIAKAQKISIKTDLSDVSARGDQQILIDLVSILIDNAIKYSPAGAAVSVSSRPKDRGACISVSDQGQGIKASELPHIFERFYRSDKSRSKEPGQGYGLGLAIARKIAELHHGFIEVNSTPGHGSTFTLNLPKA